MRRSGREEWQSGELPYQADGFEADGDDLADEADYVFGVAGAVWVVDYAGAGVGGDSVLVDYPLEGAAVAQAVLLDFGRDAGEGQESVVAELGFVFGEGHFLDAPVEFAGFSALKGVFGLLFVFEMELHQGRADTGVFGEIGGEGDAGQFALEVGGVAGAL